MDGPLILTPVACAARALMAGRYTGAIKLAARRANWAILVKQYNYKIKCF